MERKSRVRASIDHYDPSFVHFLLILLKEPAEKTADSLSRAILTLHAGFFIADVESQILRIMLTFVCWLHHVLSEGVYLSTATFLLDMTR